MKQSKTSKAWMREHLNDHYVHLAQKDGYRSRAAYKLLEISDKDNLIRPGMVVVDLGSAPGSWTQVAVQKVGKSGAVFALDILPMDPVPGVTFLQGDFREESVLHQFEAMLEGRAVDLVISDLAPNIAGNAMMDMPRSIYLIELALDFAQRHLKPGGNYLVKAFQGSGYPEYLALLKQHFEQVLTRKPKASRDRSNEIYLLGKNKRGDTAPVFDLPSG